MKNKKHENSKWVKKINEILIKNKEKAPQQSEASQEKPNERGDNRT